MTTNPSDDELTPQCPWCGERNLQTRSPQIESLDDGRWLCNTCSRSFGRGHPVTEEEMRWVGREALGLVYPGDPPLPKMRRTPLTLTAEFDEHIRARRLSR